jgi:PAS domain S-box-containing protein
MKKQTFADYRKRAEAKLRRENGSAPEAPPTNSEKLIYELQVHQIELELQNDELAAAQAAVEESRHVYADLYDFAPTAYFTFDRNGLILTLNLVGAELLGVERSLLTEKPFSLYIVAEDQALFRAHLKRVFADRQLQTCEIRIKKKNGTLDVQLQSILAPNAQHEPQCRSIVSDITVRKQAEQEHERLLRELQVERARFETVLQQMPAGVIIGEAPLGKLVLGNGQVERILRHPFFGVASINDYNKYQVFHPDGHPYQPQELPLARAIRTGEVVIDEEMDYLRGDNTICNLSVSSSPIRDENGNIVAGVVTFYDITERKRAQAEMLKASKLESIGLLAGGIAHDFNNILTAIMGNISLSKTTLSPDTDTYKGLAEAEKACLRAKGLTQQLLTFATGGVPVTKTASIAELLQDSIRFALHGSNVRCEISFPGDLKPVEVDEGQIGQVINNLIINAQQAMPDGGTITITGKNVRIETDQGLPLPPGDYIMLSVHDQGTGIPSEHLSKIFDPFYTTKAKGSGLGLATSYWIIKKHNGYIVAESEAGAGTTFFIYLPASEQPLSAALGEESAPLAGEGKVLFLDDEPSIREFVGKMLTRFGYEVECVQEGIEAIECYRKAQEAGRPFDVVVLDLTVPGGVGGKDVLRKLREINPQIKAIVCSGYSNDPILADFKVYGFSERVAKPYQIEELSKKILAVIAK